MRAVTDRRAEYYRASSEHRAADPLDFTRRYNIGLSIQRMLYAPKRNVRILKLKKRG